MSNQLEQSLVKWLKDELEKTNIDFGNWKRNQFELEHANRLDEDDKKYMDDNISRLRFRYKWLEGQIAQIQSFNKK